MPLTMEHVTSIEGRAVRYLDTGAGEPILLLHAFPLSSALWTPQLASVPAGWRIIAPDLRGFGGSARHAIRDGTATDVPARTMDDHARDALALLDLLGIERAVVGGLSMGGYVTFALYRLAPARVRALVLADTRAEADTAEGRRNRISMLESLEASGPTAVADAMMPKMLATATQRDRPALAQFVRNVIEGTDAAAIADAIRCLMTRPDSTALLPTVGVPVQLVVGREDALTPVALHESMQTLLPDAALTVIEEAGHLSNLEQPDVFNRTLTRFLHRL
jgi:pimeloyl-ACP methyl ester carboxylesterase